VNSIVFLIFRRMRRPLMTLLITYSVSIAGMVLIPGQDADGNPWRMDFFHATYFVSFMATTIGFGEIPYEFTDAQRLWVTISMYAGVISWLYAIGTILSLVQDKTFQNALSEYRLAREIREIRRPFYIICGYGETGAALVKGLTDSGRNVVVMEINEHRASLVKIENQRDYIPTLCGDAQKPLHLQEIGLEHPMCTAVVAVTNVNEANLKVAITSKLLHPNIKVICRSDSHDVENNMASFGTDYIIDPYDTFATSLATAFQMPCLHLLRSWMFSGGDGELKEPVYPPIEKHWVVCGFGRFGKAVYERLKKEGIRVVVIEAAPEITGSPAEGVIVGRGTEAATLQEAEIEMACGLIAGTDNDANNLSIVVTARTLNSDLFVIVRQNHMDNSGIINSVKADMVMNPSQIIADKIRVLLAIPLLNEFISLAYYQDDEWACELASRISGLVGNHVPTLVEIDIVPKQAGAVFDVLSHGGSVKLGDLQRDPWERESCLKCIVLMLERKNDRILLPPPTTELKKEDRLLVCAGSSGLSRLYWNLQHDNVLSYVQNGTIAKHGWLWRKLSRKRK
jgi:voltage-gated potassium channel